MANAKSTAKSTKGRKKADTRSSKDKLIDAALDLAQARRWRDLALPEIAAHAGVPIGEALLTLPSRGRILDALIDRVDAQVFSSLEKDPLDGTVKDKLFDVLMRRFDTLDGHQAALSSIAADMMRDPAAALCLGPRYWKSMALSLQAAGVSSEGCLGAVRAKALGAVQLNAVRAWVRDDDPGLAKTMAALDKGLSRADSLASRLNRRTNPSQAAAEEA